jgi:UDP-glucose 4-epimerase
MCSAQRTLFRVELGAYEKLESLTQLADSDGSALGKIGGALVTGGAGFIGSHLVDRLVSSGVSVKVFDNLSGGKISNLHAAAAGLQFIHGDLVELDRIREEIRDADIVFHMAAYPEVRTGAENPLLPYNENVRNTFNLLEAVRKSKVSTILFASSSVVYGEPSVIPTPEDYGPLLPISAYGGSKLACEALLSSYCHTYGIKGKIFRLANVIGARSRHGVIWDFINKLRNDDTRLEILGNGHQSKSYIHVKDCVEAFLFALDYTGNKKSVEIYNVGNSDRIDVISLAKVVCRTMNLRDTELRTDGGVDGGRGWIGDVKSMQLDIGKLLKMGWKPRLSSENAVEQASIELLSTF